MAKGKLRAAEAKPSSILRMLRSRVITIAKHSSSALTLTGKCVVVFDYE